ncbi:hypothetical protein Nepgr_013968 [Nepenthes gracilis]|uniref:Uncharacterized protein n=1 Tax=Nepenthes gracilis TaxID=150966 RepID=A0AAD3SJA4_NEPGR|nr:hypothetical protein Nepgr_013968 [Nepenthes gracilis]
MKKIVDWSTNVENSDVIGAHCFLRLKFSDLLVGFWWAVPDYQVFSISAEEDETIQYLPRLDVSTKGSSPSFQNSMLQCATSLSHDQMGCWVMCPPLSMKSPKYFGFHPLEQSSPRVICRCFLLVGSWVIIAFGIYEAH